MTVFPAVLFPCPNDDLSRYNLSSSLLHVLCCFHRLPFFLLICLSPFHLCCPPFLLSWIPLEPQTQMSKYQTWRLWKGETYTCGDGAVCMWYSNAQWCVSTFLLTSCLNHAVIICHRIHFCVCVVCVWLFLCVVGCGCLYLLRPRSPPLLCIYTTGDASVVAGSNVHLFEHFAPPQPYGMDNRRDPPYDTSFHGMGFGSDGR